MGFFSKIFKGVKKVFKKIGKGIKSAFKKFGKFMGKIGILGQAAMFLIMPYVGAALGGAFTGAAGALATNTVGGALGAVGQAAGRVMQFVGNTVGKAGTVFNNITQGVTDTLGNFAKTASNKMFGTTFDAASNFFTGGDSAFSRSFGADSKFQKLTTDFSKVTSSIDKTEAKLNTSSGQKALDQTVDESYGNGGMGTSETPTATTSFGPMKEGYATPETPSVTGADTPYVDIPNAQNGLMARPATTGPLSTDPTFSTDSTYLKNINVPRTGEFAPNFGPQPDSRGFFEKATDYVGDVYDNAVTKVSEGFEDFRTDPVGTLVGENPAGKAVDQFTGQIINTGAQRLVMGKPEYNVENNVAYVPSFESFGSSQQQYGAPEIMNALAFEQQVTNNPDPYGYTAFQYNNYMAQFGQTV